jgi:hypothetical protein
MVSLVFPHFLELSMTDSARFVAVQDEGLKKLLMSWYYAGYYTGLYEGQQQAKQHSQA